ncbi:MAG TPA: hypothetical protein VF275_11450 [Gammaproteobacteria bacterium]
MAHSLMRIGLRLVAVFIIVMMLQQFVDVAGLLARVQSDSRIDDDVTVFLVSIVSGIVLGGLLWWLAPAIAVRAERAHHNEVSSVMDIRSMQAAALSVLGAWFIVSTLPFLPGTVLAVIDNARSEMLVQTEIWEGHKGVLLSQLIRLVVGLFLLVSASNLSRLLIALREFGLHNKQ